MLKNSIDKTTFDALADVIKAEYKASGDTYVLQHDEDNGALKRAMDREKGRADKAEDSLTKVEGERDTLKRESVKAGSPAQIAAAAREAALAEVKPKLDRSERLETRLKTQALSATATTLAKQIGGDKNSVALMPHVERRIDVTLDDNDEPVVVIKDAKGQPTKLKAEDLVTELRANKDLAPLVAVTVGSGGAGKTTAQFTRQSPAADGGKPVRLSEMAPADRQAYIAQKVAAESGATA